MLNAMVFGLLIEWGIVVVSAHCNAVAADTRLRVEALDRRRPHCYGLR